MRTTQRNSTEINIFKVIWRSLSPNTWPPRIHLMSRDDLRELSREKNFTLHKSSYTTFTQPAIGHPLVPTKNSMTTHLLRNNSIYLKVFRLFPKPFVFFSLPTPEGIPSNFSSYSENSLSWKKLRRCWNPLAANTAALVVRLLDEVLRKAWSTDRSASISTMN